MTVCTSQQVIAPGCCPCQRIRPMAVLADRQTDSPSRLSVTFESIQAAQVHAIRWSVAYDFATAKQIDAQNTVVIYSKI